MNALPRSNEAVRLLFRYRGRIARPSRKWAVGGGQWAENSGLAAGLARRADESDKKVRPKNGLLLVCSALLLLGILCCQAVAVGQTSPLRQSPQKPDAAELADQYVAGFIERQRLEAGNAFLERELHRVKAAGEPGSPGRLLLEDLKWADARDRQALTRLLAENARPVVQDLVQAADGLQKEADELRETWQRIRRSVNRRRFLLFEVKGSRWVAGQLASLLSVDKRWFWLFGLTAIACLVGLAFHDRRHELRRLLNGGRARAMKLSKFLSAAMVVLAILTLSTFLMGNRIYEALLTVGSGGESSPRQAIAAQNTALAQEIKELEEQRQQLDSQHQQVQSRWLETLGNSLPDGAPLPWQWQQFRTQLLEIAGELAVLESVPRTVQTDLDQLDQLNRELAAHTEATARYLRLRGWIRGALGLALIGLAAVGGFLFQRGVRQRREITHSTCPLCLGRNHLDSVAPLGAQQPGLENPAPEGEPAPPEEPRREFALVRCNNVVSQQPYEECDYTFNAAYRPMVKQCFPTLGVPQAGKTHWLAMLYWTLNRGDYPKSVEFERIRSRSSEDFDVIVEEILNSRIGTAATQRDRIPHPLVFNFRDRDRWGRSNVLVNIFDYSGEVTSDMGVEDYRRRRALEAEGFFFFLDPTYPAEPQAKALADFREDLRLIRGIKTGRQIRTPVALCVSKIDRLAGQSYTLPDGGDAIQRFYDELGEIDPTGEAITMKVIEGRSRLTARLRDTIWPGWQIERQIHDLFGGRYLFFPVTPVGLDGRGESDLSLRTISPFGLLEPLLWLLQMNGYPILE